MDANWYEEPPKPKMNVEMAIMDLANAFNGLTTAHNNFVQSTAMVVQDLANRVTEFETKINNLNKSINFFMKKLYEGNDQ